MYGILVQSDKKIKYKFDHVARNTFGDMENFAVTFENGSLVMHAAGHIGKNGQLSETHQSTRVLNYNSTKKAQVFPELIIENNDVKASHAESSGQVDPEQLYSICKENVPQLIETLKQMIQDLEHGPTPSIS